MSVSEKERAALHEKLAQALGPDPAETLMEYLPPETWAELAAKEDLRLLAKEFRTELASKEDLRLLAKELRAEMASKEDLRVLAKELRAEMATKRDLRELRAEMATKEDVRVLAKELRAEMESRFAEQTRAMANQTRTLILTVAGFTLTIWVSLLVALP